VSNLKKRKHKSLIVLQTATDPILSQGLYIVCQRSAPEPYIRIYGSGQHRLGRQNSSVRDSLSPSMKERLDPRQCHTANAKGLWKSIDENIVVDTVERGGAQVLKDKAK